MPNRVTKEDMWVSEDRPIRVQLRTQADDVELHWHEYFEIEMVVDGEAVNTINGTDYDIHRGTVCLFNTTDFHSIKIKSPGGIRVFHVCLDQDILDFDIVSNLFLSDENGYFVLTDAEYARFSMLMNLCLEESEKSGDLHKKCMRNIMEIIFLLLLEKTNDGEKVSSSKNHVMKAIKYMEMNFFKDPSLEETSAHVGLNKNYFCSMFRKEAGKSYIRYLSELKLKYAKKLLTSTELSVGEICTKCGFHSLSSFLHEFKKRYNTTPLQYRQKKQESMR